MESPLCIGITFGEARRAGLLKEEVTRGEAAERAVAPLAMAGGEEEGVGARRAGVVLEECMSLQTGTCMSFPNLPRESLAHLLAAVRTQSMSPFLLSFLT